MTVEPVVESDDMCAVFMEIYVDTVRRSADRVRERQMELYAAERRRRVDAMLALHYGVSRSTVAELLGVSRATLDAWVTAVGEDPDDMAEVQQTLRDNRHQIDQQRRRAQQRPPA